MNVALRERHRDTVGIKRIVNRLVYIAHGIKLCGNRKPNDHAQLYSAFAQFFQHYSETASLIVILKLGYGIGHDAARIFDVRAVSHVNGNLRHFITMVSRKVLKFLLKSWLFKNAMIEPSRASIIVL